MESPDRGPVVRADHRGRRLPSAQKRSHRLPAALRGVGAFTNQPGIGLDPVRAHPVEKRLPPCPCRVEIQRAGDEADALVPERSDVIEPETGS